MALTKEAKIKILEAFYGLDYLYFGKPIGDVKTCCPGLREDYLAMKNSLLSIMIEMYSMVDYKPSKISYQLSSKNLKELAIKNIKTARKISENLIRTNQAKRDIKLRLKESLTSNEADINAVVKEKIMEKAYKLATDTYLIGNMVIASEKINIMNQWSGKIHEDAYKYIRESLVDLAVLIKSSYE